MNFTDARLPESVIAEIYKTSLVQDLNPRVEEPKEEEPLTPKAAKGTDQVLIAVNYVDGGDIPGEQYTFLSTVLNACQLSIKDTVIINSAAQSVRFADLKSVNPRSILLFNIEPSLFGHTPAPLTVTFIDKIPVLSAPDLKEFTSTSPQSRSLKSKLWVGLKQIFNI